ncbi:MAG: asparagine--tRNA ligase [Chitinophagales bacterium]|nr:asparagine--tRNA ligase [Chitinophagales bacterium]MDW8427332.1 asparagine--tRNA ligase [Chitinophagales bacterium]
MLTTISRLRDHVGQRVTLQGWVANRRNSKGITFLILRDGTGFCQCVVEASQVAAACFELAEHIGLESSCRLSGLVVRDERQIGGVEVRVEELQLIGSSHDYPIAKKEHGPDFLLDHRHLWLRSQRQWAIMRIRNAVIYSLHRFFQQQGFVQMDAPIFTANAVEGTSTLFETDYYGTPAYLSQSGQLYGEAMAMAMGKIYTFGPTFRAEKSKTRRHLSEFWMIEPEMAFYDLDQNMDLIEAMLQFVLAAVLEECMNEFYILNRDVGILQRSAQARFPRLTYEEAVELLTGRAAVNGTTTLELLEADLQAVRKRKAAVLQEIEERNQKLASGTLRKGEANYYRAAIDRLKNELKDLEEDEVNIPQWLASAKHFRFGNDFGGSDETVLTRLFDVPIMVYNWPHEVKAFYLKRTADGRWAKGVDVLAPEGYGEIVGGGERETDIDLLIEKIHEHKLPMQAFEWYLDLRRYGSVPHSGFGLGLERLLAWLCKLPHVREAIPFPRMYGRLTP